MKSFLKYLKNKKLHEVDSFDQSDLNLQKKTIPKRQSGRRSPISPYSPTDSRVWMSIPDTQKV